MRTSNLLLLLLGVILLLSHQVHANSRNWNWIKNKNGAYELFKKEESSMPSSPIQTKGCVPFELNLITKNKIPKGFYIGIYCKKNKNGDLFFWITAPNDESWGQTTIFEDSGKGERWRQYRLQGFQKSLKTKKIGTFEFIHNNKELTFTLLQQQDKDLEKERIKRIKKTKRLIKKTNKLVSKNRKQKNKIKKLEEELEKVQQKKDRFDLRMAFGMGQLTVNTPTANLTAIQPAVLFAAQSPELLAGIHAGTGFKYTMPFSVSSILFYELNVTGNVPISLGDGFIRPSIGVMTMGSSQAAAGITFIHTNILTGVLLNLNSLWIDANLSGVAPAGDSSYMSIGAGFNFAQTPESTGWGFGAYYQTTKFTMIISNYDQILGLAFVRF